MILKRNLISLCLIVFLAGCKLPGGFRMPVSTIFTLNKLGGIKIKVVKYSFIDDFGAGILVCYSDSYDKEIVYSFKTKECLRYETLYRTYPDYPDKEIRYLKNGKLVRSERYVAVTKDNPYTPDFSLCKEDSAIFFKVVPILDSVVVKDFSNEITDTIVFPSIIGYEKDTSSVYYRVWRKSWFRMMKQPRL